MKHHVDCDGFMTTHRQTVVRMPEYPRIRHLECETDGKITSDCGPGVTDASLQRLATCHPGEVACDGRCREWAAR